MTPPPPTTRTLALGVGEGEGSKLTLYLARSVEWRFIPITVVPFFLGTKEVFFLCLICFALFSSASLSRAN